MYIWTRLSRTRARRNAHTRCTKGIARNAIVAPKRGATGAQAQEVDLETIRPNRVSRGWEEYRISYRPRVYSPPVAVCLTVSARVGGYQEKIVPRLPSEKKSARVLSIFEL